MPSKSSTISSFIENAPPGELSNVLEDIKSLTSNDPNLLQSQTEALKKYSEDQFTTVKVPGSVKQVIISPYNRLSASAATLQYFDPSSQTSFSFDYTTQRATNPGPYTLESSNADLIQSLAKAVQAYAEEHYSSSSTGVYPIEEAGGKKVAVVIVANRYSPGNFWNGRWRSSYIVNPSSSSSNITGTIAVDVHYYEDGNVRLTTSKPISIPSSSTSSAASIVKEISKVERSYQEDLNRAFMSLSEGAFKGLRRQLPVTRQKVEWEKNLSGYRLGQDVAGGRSR